MNRLVDRIWKVANLLDSEFKKNCCKYVHFSLGTVVDSVFIARYAEARY